MIFQDLTPGRFWLGVIGTLFLVIACATVPLTGRKGLRLIPDSQLLSLSFQQYAEVLQKSKLSNDPVKVQMVKRVGERIARACEEFLRESGLESDIKNYKWEFNLIEDDKVVNAWCMPGGKVAVYTGILPLTQDETGLAVVMGHEVAHAMAKHGNERMSEALLVQLGGIGLSAALAKHTGQTQQIFLGVYGVTANLGFLLPYSRLHESEADRIGLVLMAKAGYDPGEAIAFWQRMKKKEGSKVPEFLSTHPVPETRIEQIRAHIPEAMRHYRELQN
ncbi:MAG: M48 family metallopeptidase [Syntrophaceae bacterium]|nr:M48 family metallopeptidase [Syntrophaceae bacterium]